MKKNLTTRAFSMRALDTYNEEHRSVRAIATTEAPVRVFDWDQYDFVNEVLRMDGMVLPKSGQVPLLDSHNRHSVADVLGSARDFNPSEVDGIRAVECSVSYAATPDGLNAAAKTRDGHLTDYSVGYRVIEAFWVPEGQKQIIGGDAYEGPVKVVTRWELKELSATPIGADAYAKARSEEFQGGRMKKEEQNKDNDKKEPARADGNTPPDAVSKEDAERMAKAAAEKAVQEERERAEAETARRDAIREMCKMAGLDETADDMIRRGLAEDAARKEIFERMANSRPGAVGPGAFRIEADAADKFRAAAVDGLTLRSGVRIDKPAAGASTFRGVSLLRLAEMCLRNEGVDTAGMTNTEIARKALSARAIPGTGTGHLPTLLMSTAERVLRDAYLTWPVTWRRWARATDASDFRPINRVALTGAPELDLIPEGGEYKDFKLGEFSQSYVIKKYGKKFSVTWEAIVNDDLSALTRVPRMFGGASSRLVNTSVYGVLTANAAMWDGKALFHADHRNLAAGADVGPPTTATMKAARKTLRTQQDPDGVSMNIIPVYGLFPAALEHEAYVILNSATLTQTGSGDNANPNIPNPYRSMVDPVIDPVLDAASESVWYLVAAYSQIDTVEVAFLDGREEPEIMEIENVNIDGVSWKARICFGAAVIDWRGLYKNPGA